MTPASTPAALAAPHAPASSPSPAPTPTPTPSSMPMAQAGPHSPATPQPASPAPPASGAPATGEPGHDASPRAEAARYALLRRLAPALRHEAAAHLQPITMASSVLERRLAAPAPDLPQLRDGVLRLTGFSRSAVQTCLDLVGWLSPPQGARLPLAEAVARTTQLLATPLAFDGFSLVQRLGEQADTDTRPADTPEADASALAQQPVDANALRLVLPACLLWLTDQAEPPLQVRVDASPAASAGHLALRLSLAPPPPPLDGYEKPKAGPRREPAYRRLGWSEVEALALEEGLDLSVRGQGADAAVEVALPLDP